ncbi:nitrite reductase small subunit NirD [Actinomycetota bacterium]
MTWTPVCRLDRLVPDRAAAALVNGAQVAVVRTSDGGLYCVGHWDPVGQAHVMARGIVGSRSLLGVDVPTLSSPLYKEAYDLRTGVCVTDPAVRLGAWQVRVADGVVEVGPPVSAESGDEVEPDRSPAEHLTGQSALQAGAETQTAARGA